MRCCAVLLTLSASAGTLSAEGVHPGSLRLVPFPKEVELSGGSFRLDRPLALEAGREVAPLAARLLAEEFRARGLEPPKVRERAGSGSSLRISAEPQAAWSPPELPGRASLEGYALEIDAASIRLAGGSRDGLLHAVQTLRQLIRANAHDRALPALRIRDWPSIRWRAFQDDITRGPSSTLEELEREVSLGAYFKHNVFTYYMQSQFAFQKHPDIGPPEGSLSAGELRELVRFAEPLGVRILGNQQSFAHLQDVLRLPAYAHLREDARTLSPAIEGTYRLLDDLYSEVIPVLPFEFFNVCCDETWGLGSGPSKELAEKIGVGGVYLRHVLRVRELVSGKYGKRMMMWGDIILQHPEKISELPKDIVLLTWGYDARDSFDDQIVPFARSGHEFFVCPGVKCWGEVLPNFATAVANIRNFVRDGAKRGALGVLNTSWDDDGENLNAPNWHGFAWGAECAWNASATRYEDFQERIGAVLFGEGGRRFADAVEALSAKQARGYDGFTNATFWTREAGPVALADAPREIERAEAWIADVRRAIEALQALREEAKANRELLDAFLHGARRFELFCSRKRSRIEAALAYREAARAGGEA
ncbi:MAG: beta-N-acetylhexosaminidase, partial [Planctomycetota bacterium]